MSNDNVKLTIRSHYNPCFWTANWNPTYFKAAQSNRALPNPRTQTVSVLNVIADKILINTTSNVHLEKNGTLMVSKEEAKLTCQSWMPENYQEACQEIDASPGTGYAFHYEALQTRLENSSAYMIMKRVINRGILTHTADKVNLAWAVVLQHLRNPWILRSIGDALEANGRQKLELYLSFARLLNSDIMMPTVQDLMNCEWVMYKTYKDEFPLTDSAVLIGPETRMIALSPRLLLEIGAFAPQRITFATYHNSVPPEKMEDFRKRSIAITFKEIISSNESCLKEWKTREDYVLRRQEILDKKPRYSVTYSGEVINETWLMNVYRGLLFPNGL